MFYSETKEGVDIVDDLCSNYNVSHNTKRRPMAIFYAVLRISEINSMIIYKIEASRGAAARGVTVKPTGCGFDPHSRR